MYSYVKKNIYIYIYIHICMSGLLEARDILQSRLAGLAKGVVAVSC